ncbi:EF-hand domain-containing protein [Streptomyces sp. NBC_00249]|uniref:EF-hand domain-containing protein n=1 Tax=Streptomyces sp. NBC_00249 TaxID=2975690 RepID=UPI00224F2792|nr:EF-hand domain-containing protein [Streptomyces sp. NBC_00249]MCX5194255.1 EF-hand domain-containing protein [Streptomyces sp. NBC_00249]
MADIESARATFDKFDVNGDGFITADEYSAAMKAMGDAFVTPAVADSIVAAKDLDSDGLLSFDEFWADLNK